MAIYRQGDILIVSDEVVPSAAIKVVAEGGRIILAHGEVTGHAHVISETDDADLVGVSDEVDRWLRVRSATGVTVAHPEHAPIHLPTGTYRIVRQREYSPRSISVVMD